MKWNYFFGACLIVGAALLKAGAPVISVIAGLGLAALFNYFRYRSNPARTISTVATER
ncbi:MAG: hypothetical protein M3Z32_04915 [Acidobacteriota bacterium]|nr:hypothetical protein [Acidobacteriota bacterium]